VIAANAVDYPEVLVRLFVDLVAISVMCGGLFLRRHHRRDLVTVFAAFNIGLFAVVSVISSRHISVGLGFGLFAVLSIIRLRSEPFDNTELAYFFTALVLALVGGLRKLPVPFAVLLDALPLATLFLVDHPAFHTNVRRRRVRLDAVRADAGPLREELSRRFGVEIVDLAITEVDDVRETTDVTIRYVDES
jgi:hypothetical protein